MPSKPSKLKLKRLLRRRQRQVEDISVNADENLEKHFFKRLNALSEVKRFVVGWLLLMALLMLVIFLQAGMLRDKFQKPTYASGGSLNEGIVGSYSNANPIYASNSVDSSVSKLIFSGLLKYDSKNNLVPDLAEHIELDKGEKVYTVKLRKNLKWHDGYPLRAKDVVFTFKTIQEPDAKSPLLTSWQSVKVEAKDDHTVIFTLTNTLSPFPHSLTTGIIPEHLLKNVPIEQLRSSDFNTIKPIGSGPFKFERIEIEKKTAEIRNEQIGLVGNSDYHHGKPGLNRYVIKTFENQAALEDAYSEKRIEAYFGVTEKEKERASDQKNNIYPVSLTGQTMVFFKNSAGILSDPKMRKALVLGADRQAIIDQTGLRLIPSDEPFLKTQTPYDKNYQQKTKDLSEAKKILDGLGWKLDPTTRLRAKNQNKLIIRLVFGANQEYELVANSLKKQWEELGVDLQITKQEDYELKSTIANRNYDALISSISLGADPDVFAFWHSSQFDPISKTRLNFSDYNSPLADASLEAGRSRSDAAIRAIKYKPFLAAWSKDNPALALYQPRYVFIIRSPFTGFEKASVVNTVDRYADVGKWMSRLEKR